MTAPAAVHAPDGRPPFHPSQRRPRDAGTLILVDQSGEVPRILLGKRNARLAFMPGRFVFPGGRVESGDGRVPVASALDPAVERRLLSGISRPSQQRACALALAAIRELAEETGIFVGERQPWTRSPAPDWRPFAEHGVTPALGEVSFIARAITPPGQPRRYDTRFFALDAAAIAHRLDVEAKPDDELVELRWASFAETADMDLHPITRVILRELGTRIEAGWDRDLPVPFFRFRAGAITRDEI